MSRDRVRLGVVLVGRKSVAERAVVRSRGTNQAVSPMSTATSPVRLRVGNQVVQRSLRVGRVGDRLEREADEVAERVMRMPVAGVSAVGPLALQGCPGGCPGEEELQRQPVEEDEGEVLLQAQPVEEEEEEPLQAKGGVGGGRVDAATAGVIGARRGAGVALPVAERSFFEPRFGRSFAGVRVHADAGAQGLARRVNARAFTVGRDVFFGAGEWQPGSTGGRRLLAHELTHVTQQGGNSATHPESLGPSPQVRRTPREVRIRAASRAYVIPPGTSGCYLHLLLLIDAARNVRPLTTAGEVERYRKLKRIARGATVSDLVALLKTKGIARRSRWFHYPDPGRPKYRTLKKLALRGDPEGFVMSRVKAGEPAYFAVSFRNIHSGFILVTSVGKVLWLDQGHRGGTDVTGSLNGFLSRYLDRYVVAKRKYHAWYGSTRITELRF